MFGQKSTRQIDLHLPTGWNRCTTEELEAIAAAIIQEQQRVDRYHPFDWSRVKISVALSINEITVLRDNEIAKGDESEWIVRRPQDSEPWPITTGQLVAVTEQLAWVNDEKASKVIFQFPYPELTLVHGSGFMVQGSLSESVALQSKRKAHGSKPLTINREPLTVAGPPPLLDGYTWNEYRLLTDWMQEYMRHANALLQVKSEELRVKNLEAMENARNEFLAVLFKPAGKPTGTIAGNDDGGSKFFTLNSSLFTSLDAVKWQVILFWWSSLMKQLEKKFPKVFKLQPVSKNRSQKQDTPWDFYNRMTAMLADEYKSSETDQQNETYSVTLQKLENVAEKSAEMEKLKHKK